MAEVFGDEIVMGGDGPNDDFGRPAPMMRILLRDVGPEQPTLRRARMLASLLKADPSMMQEATLGHCEVADCLAERLGLPPRIRQALWQMFERWDGRGAPRKLRGEELLLPVRVVAVAQRAEWFHRLSGVAGAIANHERVVGPSPRPLPGDGDDLG